MSFLRKRKSSKVKTIRGDSKLARQKGMDTSKESRSESREDLSSGKERKKTSLQDKISFLEGRLNTAETRSVPSKHITIIRQLNQKSFKYITVFL